jgi:hypothetical protein
MALWVSVQGFVNREYLEESVLNRPIRQLRERTDYLFRRLEDIAGDDSRSSLRMVDVPLATDTDYVPQVKDFVYLNPETKVYEQALATIDVAKSLLFETDYPGFAVGLLISKSADGTKGTIVISGKVLLSDVGNWDLSELVETGEAFRSGPYYLSAVQRGRITQYPNGPEIYLGYFADNNATPGAGGYALVSPQYRSFAEAHIHQSFPLSMQPNGSWNIGDNDVPQVTGFSSDAAKLESQGTHAGVTGADLDVTPFEFIPGGLVGLRVYNVTKHTSGIITNNTGTLITAPDTGDWDPGDEYYIEDGERIVVIGDYKADYATDYTLVLTDATGTQPPIGMADFFIKYMSSDPTETGLVRVLGYEIPITIGNKGLRVYLQRTENGNETVVHSSTDTRRHTYTFRAADETESWVPNTFHAAMSEHVVSSRNYTMYVLGGPTTETADRVLNLTTRLSYSYVIDLEPTLPVDGDTITIAGTVFEFDNNSSVSANAVRVQIVPGDAEATVYELQSAILEAGLTDVTPIVLPGTGSMAILRDSGVSDISASGAFTYGATVMGSNVWLIEPYFVVYNDSYEAVTATLLTAMAGAWESLTLSENLRLCVSPFASNGDALTEYKADVGDYWTVELDNEAPAAKFKYNLGMNAGLSKFYPPVPLKAASFVLNGLELESHAHFPTSEYKDYMVAYGGLYWYGETFPWPSDWDNGGEDAADVKLAVLHLVRPRAGETGLVRSLQPAPDAPVSITRCGTNEPASTGDLQIDVDLTLRSRDDDLRGYRVFKEVRGNRLLGGPVVSRIVPGPGYSVTSPPGVPNGYGDVQLNLDNAVSSGEFDAIALQNAKEEMIGLFPYVKLLGWSTGGSNIPSGFTAKFALPATLTGLYRFVVSMVVFGEADINSGGTRQWVGMDFTYSVLHDYMPADDYKRTLVDGLITPAPTDPIHWDIPLGEDGASPVYTAYDPMVVHTAPDQATDNPAREFRASMGPYPKANDLLGGVVEADLGELALRAGSQIAIQIKRATAIGSPEYQEPVGIINLRWRLVQVE